MHFNTHTTLDACHRRGTAVAILDPGGTTQHGIPFVLNNSFSLKQVGHGIVFVRFKPACFSQKSALVEVMENLVSKRSLSENYEESSKNFFLPYPAGVWSGNIL